MLFSRAELDGIRSGAITSLYRCWSRPFARAGSAHRVHGELISIGDVEHVDARELTDDLARAAGFATAADLRAELDRWEGEHVYRIAVAHAGADPLLALRDQSALDHQAIADVLARLGRMDASAGAAWTRSTLLAIEHRPGTRARDLAETLGRDVHEFKRDVRKLKGLGLTISLERGYQLSPRGRVVLSAIAENFE